MGGCIGVQSNPSKNDNGKNNINKIR